MAAFSAESHKGIDYNWKNSDPIKSGGFLGSIIKRSEAMYTPRQFGNNCIYNSITAILLELRTCYGYQHITDIFIKQYRRHFVMFKASNTVIEEALERAFVSFRFIVPEGSLMESLRENQVCLAIAINCSTKHAYPIKKHCMTSQYLTINQSGSFMVKPVYSPLIDTDDTHYYAVELFRLPRSMREAGVSAPASEQQSMLEDSWELT